MKSPDRGGQGKTRLLSATTCTRVGLHVYIVVAGAVAGAGAVAVAGAGAGAVEQGFDGGWTCTADGKRKMMYGKCNEWQQMTLHALDGLACSACSASSRAHCGGLSRVAVDVPAWRAQRIFSSDALDARSRDTASTAPVLMGVVCQGSRLKATRHGGHSRRAGQRGAVWGCSVTGSTHLAACRAGCASRASPPCLLQDGR